MLAVLLSVQLPILAGLYTTTVSAQSVTFEKQLKALPGVLEVSKLKCDTFYKEKYLVRMKQWIDPKDTLVGWFSQRIWVMHLALDRPVVLTTEGYMGDYAGRSRYIDEVAGIVGGNNIFVEHRYFGESNPKNPDWKYLTAENAAADHHHVTEVFQMIYKNKWINTGVSKGGQTALIHRYFYPNDVDVSVCYVAPLNFGVEDGRHEPFIDNVATAEDRKAVRDFQLEVLKRRKTLMPLFKEFCDKSKYTFNIPLDEVYDYCVLEYSFSFWQWGFPVSSIPGVKAKDNELLDHLFEVCSPDYFSHQGIESTQAFFVQAAHELGYYGYDTKPFEKYLAIKSAKGYLNKIFMPKDYQVKFDSTLSQNLGKFVQTNDRKMIFIYGQYDPWSAPGVTFTKKRNMYKFVCPAGSHSSRIRSFPDEEKSVIIEILKSWMEE
jgi:hypothetical protein